MAIINLMVDVVTGIVHEVLKKTSELPEPEIYEPDITAYVLNRIPPKYITSERGILHGKLESRYIFQQKTDILLLVHEAIDVIKKRRPPLVPRDKGMYRERNAFLPHLMGEVLEETTFSMIPGMEVTLKFGGKPAKMIDVSWKNPCVTNKATKGFYHFWPDFIEGEMQKKKNSPFTIHFRHPRCQEKEVEVDLGIIDNFELYKSHIVPIVLIQTREGVDTSFLYE